MTPVRRKMVFRCSANGRALDHKMMEEIRTQAVQRVEAGESLEEVIRVLDCTARSLRLVGFRLDEPIGKWVTET